MELLRRLWWGSIRNRLVVGIGALLAVVISVFVADMVRQQIGSLHRENQEMAKALAQTLAANSVSWVLANDLAGLQEVASSVKRFPDLRYAMIIARDGRVLAHTDPQLQGRYARDPVSGTLLRARPAPQFLVNDASLIDVAVPVQVDGKHLGWARVGLSQDTVSAHLRTVARNGFIYAVSAITLGALLVLILTRGLTRDLTHLIKMTHRVSAGERGVQSGLRRDDELGELSDAFDSMTMALDRASRALRHSETSLKEAQRIAHIGNWELDLAGNVLTWTDEIYRIFEIDPAKFGASYEAFLGAIHPDDRERVNKAYTDSLTSKMPYVIEHRLLMPDGRVKYVQEQCETHYADDGTPLRSIGTVQDITERKRTEREAIEQFKLAEAFFNHSVSCLVILDRHFNFVRVNDAYARTCHKEIGEFVGRNHFEMYPSDAQAIFEEVVRDKRPFTTFTRAFVYPEQPERGTTYWDWTLVPVLDEQGEVEYLVFSLNEVTERRRAEEDQRAAALYARSLIEASLDPLVTISPAGKITDANKATEDVTGVARERLIGTDFSDYFTEPGAARAGYQQVLALGYVRDYPLTIRHSAGRTTDVLYHATVYHNEAGEVQGVFAAARDITERKRAEQVRLAHLRFIESLDRVNRAIQGTNDLEQMMSDVLDAALSMFECDRAWLIYPCDPETPFMRVPMVRTRPEYPGALATGADIPAEPAMAETFRMVLEEPGPICRGPGSKYPLPSVEAERFGIQSSMQMAVRPMSGKPWMFGLHQCSGPRVWTAEELRLFQEIGRRLADALTGMLMRRDLQRNEEFLDSVVENIPDMIFVKDVEALRFVRFNKAGEQLLGYSRRDLLGKNDYDFFPKEEADFFTAKDREVLGGKGLVDIPEETINTRAQGERILHTKKIPIMDNEGKPQYLLGISEDITGRKQAETVRAQLAAIVQSSNDAIIGQDLDGVITSWNPGAEKVYGYRADEVLGKPVSMLAAEGREDEIGQLLERIRRGEAILNYETECYRKDRRRIDISLDLSPLREAAGRIIGAAVIARDITGKKQAERALHKLNRALKTLSDCNMALIHATDEARLLNEICHVIIDSGGYRLAWVGYVEHDAQKTVRPVAQSGYEPGYLEHADITWADNERGRGPLGTAVRTGQVQVVQDVMTDPCFEPWRANASRLGYGSVLVAPLLSGSEVIGALSIYAANVNAFDAAEIALLGELAADMAFGIVTLRTRGAHDRSTLRLQRNMEETVAAIAATVEMRDPYTAGHQRRVAELATAIARELGLPEDRVHGVHLAGVVHDLGKIHIPAEILSKPGKLGRIEFELIKTHPEAGYDILKGVDFPWPIAQVVLQHHERLDGSGYPSGLKGDEILREARILTVADVVEAMASHRPYRASLGIDLALEEISRNAGKYYDADVVRACVALFRDKAFAFAA